MSVTQYEMRFSELDRHAIWFVPTDRERIRRFIDGLNYGLHFVMTREITLGLRFDEVVDIARRLEQVRSREHEEREAKRLPGSGGFSSALFGGQSYHRRGRPCRPAQMACSVHRGALASHGSYSSCPGQSSLSALPAQSSSRALLVQGSSVPVPSSSYFGAGRLVQSPPPLTDQSCFECREFGHMRRYCPRILGGPV
ncbi:uncharacterized protein [Nicotiana tomentosiformis]|uniref:uncharacterized protein n=1 Tax=Nicotiana tomentosiformis TaxID=4098 RepID=UPI00388C489E